MAASASFIEYVKDLFAPFGDIIVKKMFGGAGVYCDDLFFAIIGDDDLWFKADDETRDAFSASGCERFSFEMKDGRIGEMSYYSAPEEIFDDHDALRLWTTRALDAARRSKKPKPKKKRAVQRRKKTEKR